MIRIAAPEVRARLLVLIALSWTTVGGVAICRGQHLSLEPWQASARVPPTSSLATNSVEFASARSSAEYVYVSPENQPRQSSTVAARASVQADQTKIWEKCAVASLLSLGFTVGLIVTVASCRRNGVVQHPCRIF